MRAFWDNGYEGTSLEDLVEAMGLKKGSIYKAFGDKHALFMAALERYLNGYFAMMSEIVAKSDSALAAVSSLFEYMNNMATKCSDVRHGCLAMNTMVELAAHDEQVEAFMVEGYKRTERKLTDLIRWGQENGEFRQDEEAQVLARYLFTSLTGICVASKAIFSIKDMEQTEAFVISNLRKRD